MRKWTIKVRIAAALVLGALCALALILAVLEMDYSEDVKHSAIESLGAASETFATLQQRDTVMLAAALDGLMDRPDLVAALSAEDTATLLARAAPLQSVLESKRGITHMYFISPEGRILLRVHRPLRSGDLVDRATFRKSRATKTYGSGLELGVSAFALRVVHPVYLGGSGEATSTGARPFGRLVGYMEVAEEVDHFMKAMPLHGGKDGYAMLLFKDGLEREDWTRYRAENGQRDDWDDHKSYVLASTTSTQTHDIVDSVSLPETLGADPRLVTVTQDPQGRATSVGVFPIIDASGKTAGAIAMSHDVSGVLGLIRETQLRIGLVVSALMVAMWIAVVVLLNRLVFRRLDALAQEDQGTNLDRELEPRVATDNRLDEIGMFEHELARGRRELEVKSMLLDTATDVIWVHDVEGTILYANEAAVTLRGFSLEELLHMNISEIVAPPYAADVKTNTERIMRHGFAVFESSNLTKSGEEIPVEVHARLIEVGGRPAIMSVARDLTDRRRAAEAIQQLAYVDHLTGLANRRMLDDRLESAMALCRRNNSCLGVLFLDLDRLKQVNDTFGHSGGDMVLTVVADRLREVVREVDTVARVAGDEFVLLLSDTEADSIGHVADRILEVLGEAIAVGQKDVHMTASIGITLYRGEDETAASLLRHADLAMYSAKSDGRNRHCIFDEEMGALAGERSELQQELAKALEKGELTLHYQPQVRFDDGVIVGAEALCRWFHPTRGAVSPSTFIPMAEESGLIVPLGRWVILEACRQARVWMDEGLEGVRVSVNASAQQFIVDDIVETVSSALQETGLPPNLLGIEVTEGTALGGSDAVRQSLASLHDLGVLLAVDDFGIGYSAFDSIASQPFGSLKIDRFFVSAMDAGPGRMAIIRTMVDLGRHLGLETIAEGVETEGQAQSLSDMSCEIGQGYLYAPALASDEFLRYARRQPSK